MNNAVWRTTAVVVPALLGLSTLPAAQAGELDAISGVQQYALEAQAMGQVTSVSQLRDVMPTDWAFQALQSLVERYGCIAGYPDGTYRGNRAMTRYEFAAGLNACLDRVNELIASATADLVTTEDLAVLQRLQEEFQAELATLRGRVDALEARTAELEANQFSTTTKLRGQVIYDLGSVASGQVNGADAESEVTFGGRVRLALNTSFTGRDLLRTRLQAGVMGGYGGRFENDQSAPEADIAWNGGSNNVVMNELYYNFPIGKANVYVGTHGLDPDDVAPTLATYGASTLLDFLEDNTVYDAGASGAGVGATYPLTDAFSITGGYFANTGDSDPSTPDAASAGDDSGFFNGSNQYFGQLTFEPSNKFVVAGTYSRTYDTGPTNSYTTGNTFGLSAAYAFSPKFTLTGWAGWADYEGENGADDREEVNWAAILGFPDLFGEGNYGSIGVGEYKNDDEWFNNIAAQAIYRFQLSDSISIQPGVAWIPEPLGDDDNDSIFIGNVRTVFSF